MARRHKYIFGAPPLLFWYADPCRATTLYMGPSCRSRSTLETDFRFSIFVFSCFSFRKFLPPPAGNLHKTPPRKVSRTRNPSFGSEFYPLSRRLTDNLPEPHRPPMPDDPANPQRKTGEALSSRRSRPPSETCSDGGFFFNPQTTSRLPTISARTAGVQGVGFFVAQLQHAKF